VIGAVCVFVHIIGAVLTRYYYTNIIPHYDSVGGLLQAGETLQMSRTFGYLAGLQHAWGLAPLSILQNVFPGLLSLFLDPTPHSLQLYNSCAFAVAAFSVTWALRSLGAGIGAILLTVAAILLGDALYWWDLGIFDFRRDFAMYALFIATLFMGMAAVDSRDTAKTPVFTAVAFGVLVGLAALSRDSAPLLLTLLILAPIGVFWAWSGFKGEWRRQFTVLGLSLAGFVPFGLMWLSKLDALLQRVANPLIMYGVDPNGQVTFFDNLRRIPDAITGVFRYPFQDAIWLSPVILIGFAIGIWFATRSSHSAQARRTPAQHRAAIFLLACAVWIPIALHSFLSIGLKWAANQPPIVAMAPYLPVLISLVAVSAAACLWCAGSLASKRGTAIAGLVATLVLAAMPARALTRLIDYPPGTYKAHLGAVSLSGANGQPARYAVLTQKSELFRVPAIQFLAQSRGLPPPKLIYFKTSKHDGLDFQIAVPPAAEDQQLILAAMDQAIRCDADYIVVETDLSQYALSDVNLLLYAKGQDMMRGVLRDLGQNRVLTLDAASGVYMLDNRSRSTCLP
jgi:hypothetical protein